MIQPYKSLHTSLIKAYTIEMKKENPFDKKWILKRKALSGCKERKSGIEIEII